MIELPGFSSLIFTSSSRLTFKVPFANLLSKPFSLHSPSSYILLVSLIQVLGTLLRFSK